MSQKIFKDKLAGIIYEIIKESTVGAFSRSPRVADLTPSDSGLFMALCERIATMHEDREFEIRPMISHKSGEARVHFAWGDREATFAPHQAMAIAAKFYECANIALAEAFLYDFIAHVYRGTGEGQTNAHKLITEFREFRAAVPDLGFPQPMEVKKRGEGE